MLFTAFSQRSHKSGTFQENTRTFFYFEWLGYRYNFKELYELTNIEYNLYGKF